MELNTVADALSGLQANQTYMDVVGNNIANVNTTGYKTQSIRFADLMNQTLSYGSQANGNLQGIDAFQVGMGVGTGSTAMINTQGSVQETGRSTDMAIQGNGYFVLSDGQHKHYTRDGSFTVSPDGILESPATGMKVQGWLADPTTGAINNSGPVTDIAIPLGSQQASATTKASLSGNLDASQPNYSAGPPPVGQFVTTMTVYDSLGNSHDLTVTFQKQNNNTWGYNITAPNGANFSVSSGASGTLNFNSNGQLTTPISPQNLGLTFTNGAANGTIAVDFSHITQVAQTSAVNVANADGTPGGTISTVNVGKDGTITAVYSNGSTKTIGQMALADFRNPDGLVREGNNLFAQGINSGSAQIGAAGTATLGAIETGQLEGSNVDLAAQFAQMIQAQQGFNANTKVVTTTNNMLQSVMSIVQ